MTYTPPEQPGQPSGGYHPYQPAGQQPYGFAAAPASTKKTLSLWGPILGISSIVIPIWINAIAGAVLSGIGLAKEPQGKTMAIWGLVTSVLGFIWAFIFWPLLITVIFAAAFSAEYGGV